MLSNLAYLRTIDLDDAEFLYELFQYPEYEELFDEYNTTLETWQTRCMMMIQNSRSHDFIICLNRLNTPIGYIGLFECLTTKELELQVMVLQPQYCGLGIGSQMLNQIKNQFNQTKHQYMTLKTAIKNQRAKQFYEKHSFIEFGKEFIEQSDETFIEIYIRMRSTLSQKKSEL